MNLISNSFNPWNSNTTSGLKYFAFGFTIYILFTICVSFPLRCSDCRVWAGLTKQGSGVYRFTDKTRMDFEPNSTVFKIFDFDTKECFMLYLTELRDQLCTSDFPFICMISGKFWFENIRSLDKCFWRWVSITNCSLFWGCELWTWICCSSGPMWRQELHFIHSTSKWKNIFVRFDPLLGLFLSSDLHCPVGYFHQSPHKACIGKHYKRITFKEAETECQSNGGHLPSFHDEDYYNFLKSQLTLYVFSKQTILCQPIDFLLCAK